MKLTEIHSNGNIRKDLGDVKDLAASIKAQGLIEPLVVKKSGKGYILLAGHRRFAAAKLAGVTDVPVHIIDIKDEDVEGLQLAENIHRKDLTPHEICATVSDELDRRGFRLDHDGIIPAGLDEVAEEIALKTGAKKNYVKQMARLAFLPPYFKKLLENDNLTVGQALMILQLPPEEQANVEKNFYGFNQCTEPGDHATTSQLERFINKNFGVKLSKAPFSLDEPVGDKLPCATCSYNTSNTTELFPAAGGGICRLSACFKSKLQTVSTGLKNRFLSGFDAKVQGVPKFLGYVSLEREFGNKVPTEIKGMAVVKKDGDAFFVARATSDSGPVIYQVKTKGKPVKKNEEQRDILPYVERYVTDAFAEELVYTPAAKKVNKLKVTVKTLLPFLDGDVVKMLKEQKGEITYEMMTRAIILDAIYRNDDNADELVGIDRAKIMDPIRAKVRAIKKDILAAWKPAYFYSTPDEAFNRAVLEAVRTGKPLAYAPAPTAAAASSEKEEDATIDDSEEDGE